jgi:hypothetical protein
MAATVFEIRAVAVWRVLAEEELQNYYKWPGR